MIILLRGNNGSGKSTVVHQIKKRLFCAPIYGVLGGRNPEAYRCQWTTTPRSKTACYILGPYESTATAGGDYLTKKGVATLVDVLEKYRAAGNLLFESILTSIRFMEPTVGAWLEQHKSEVIAVTLTTTREQCMDAIKERRQSSIASSHSAKHFLDNHHRFELVTAKLLEKGFRVEYASRDEAAKLILGLL